MSCREEVPLMEFIIGVYLKIVAVFISGRQTMCWLAIIYGNVTVAQDAVV
jgi:hypothetical protein